MISKYEWILFDLDNTLLDFSRVSRFAFASALENLGVKNDSSFYDIYSPINAKYWHYFEKGKISAADLQVGRFRDFFEAIDNSTDPEKMGERYLDFLVHHSSWIEGAESLLDKVSKTHQLAIITNGLSNAQHRRLEKHEMKSFFQHIFISEEMGTSKPNQLYFEKVYEQIGFPEKSKVLVVGDNPNSDIKGGRNFGYDTCWYDYRQDKKQNVNATFKINSICELIK